MTDLLAETFEAPDPAATCAGEQRRQHRVLFCQQAWVVPVTSPDKHHSVILHDISTVGAGFVSSHPFAPGAWVVMSFHFPNGAWRKLLCYTWRCQELPNGLFHTGAQFEAAMEQEEPTDTVPSVWTEWARDQTQKETHPLGGPVLEPELIACCGNVEADFY